MTLTIENIVYIAGVITAVSVACNWIVQWISKARKPMKTTEDRLNRHDEILDKDNKRLLSLEEQDRLVMQGLLALLEHSIDGNNIQQMKDVKDSIQKFLISK